MAPPDPAVQPCIDRLRAGLDAALELPASVRAAAIQNALHDFADDTEIAALIAHCGPPCATSYGRQMLVADPQGRYCAVALIWGQAQFSPIHGHHTWCAYRVLSGALHESVFEWDKPTEQAHWQLDQARLPGAISYTDAGVGGIHRLGNPHAAAAVSLHVYGIEAAQVTTHVNLLVDVPHAARNAASN